MSEVVNLDTASILTLAMVALAPPGSGYHYEQKRYARALITARRLRKRGRIGEAMVYERKADVAYQFLPARFRW